MAKKNINAEIEALINSGNATLAADNKFVDKDGKALGVRSMDSINDPLEVGDIISIPADYKVLTTEINGNPACFTMAIVKSGDEERVMRFFPNSLAKIAFPLDENGKRMPKVKTTGTVATWYQEQEGVDPAVKALVGRDFKVTSKTSYKVHNRFTDTDENTNILSYDFV